MPERHDDGIDRKAQAAEVALVERISAADAAFGAGADYDRDRVTAEVRHHLGQGALAMLEAGRRLCWLRDREPHGEWMGALALIGIGQSVANKMMQAARKFVGPNSELVTNLASVTKTYELAMLDDEDLDELREGGTVAGLTLDDIDRMAPSELRAALRAERKEKKERADAQRKVATRRQERIDELEQANERLRHPERIRWDERAAARLNDMYAARRAIVRNAWEMKGVLVWCGTNADHVDPRQGLHFWGELARGVEDALEQLEQLTDMLKVPPEAWQEDLAADGEDGPAARREVSLHPRHEEICAAEEARGLADDE